MWRSGPTAGEPDDRGRRATAIWIDGAGSGGCAGRQGGPASRADHHDIFDRQRLGHHPAVLERQEERQDREEREGRREEERRQTGEKVQSEVGGSELIEELLLRDVDERVANE